MYVWAMKRIIISTLALTPMFVGLGSVDIAWAGQSTARSIVSLEDQHLEALQGHQSAAEIEALESSGRPVTVLLDEHGRHVAAIETPGSPFGARAISPVGPGCSVSSACVTAGGVPYGYKGTGTRAVSHPSTTRVFAGDHSTGFWVGDTIHLARPGVTLKFPSAKKITSITRS